MYKGINTHVYIHLQVGVTYRGPYLLVISSALAWIWTSFELITCVHALLFCPSLVEEKLQDFEKYADSVGKNTICKKNKR